MINCKGMKTQIASYSCCCCCCCCCCWGHKSRRVIFNQVLKRGFSVEKTSASVLWRAITPYFLSHAWHYLESHTKTKRSAYFVTKFYTILRMPWQIEPIFCCNRKKILVAFLTRSNVIVAFVKKFLQTKKCLKCLWEPFKLWKEVTEKLL